MGFEYGADEEGIVFFRKDTMEAEPVPVYTPFKLAKAGHNFVPYTITTMTYIQK